MSSDHYPKFEDCLPREPRSLPFEGGNKPFYSLREIAGIVAIQINGDLSKTLKIGQHPLGMNPNYRIGSLPPSILEEAAKVQQMPKTEAPAEAVQQMEGIDELIERITQNVADVLVPSNGGNGPIRSGIPSDRTLEFTKTERLKLTIEALMELGITLKEGDIIDGIVSENMLRKTPYTLIKAGETGYYILVCNEVGNRSFIFKSENEESALIQAKKNKDELKEDPLIQHFIWEGPENHKQTIKQILQKPKNPTEQNLKLDSTYFENPNYIRADLEAFAAASNPPIEGIELCLTTKELNRKANLSNGKFISLGVYLCEAAKSMGIAKTAREAISIKADVLKTLKERAGLDLLNEKHFKDRDSVRADLEAFVNQGGHAATTALDLTVSLHQIRIKAELPNKEKLTFGTYLNKAAVALGLAMDTSECSSVRSIILEELKKTAGYEALNQHYFNNASNVRSDLEAFGSLRNPPIAAADLDTKQSDTTAKLQNGQEMSFARYVSKAAISMGWSASSIGTHTAQNIAQLKQLAGLKEKAARA